MPKAERKLQRRPKGVKIEVDYKKLVEAMFLPFMEAVLPQFLEAALKNLPNKEQYERAIESLNAGNAGLQDLNKKVVGELSTSLEENEGRLAVIEEKLGITKTELQTALEPPVL